jgi:YVTN family beta-propeller protein
MVPHAPNSRRLAARILGTFALLIGSAALGTGQPSPALAAASWPASRGNLFAGGAGGTATLVQETPVTPTAQYDVSAWLGGTKTSAAELTVQFQDASGDVPFLNSLRTAGATLTNFYAEEHPSGANYLALAGGSAFGVPLTDPEEENPLYTINAANIGDLVSESGESWKVNLQSANGPCDDTVHGYYWNNGQPMLYFQDVRDRPRYCASHVVPLEELTGDLPNPATTPNFAWIAPDDCSDMEGCGITAGDAFLKTKLTEIMNSPAWRTQRWLAIITFDEDAVVIAGQTAVALDSYAGQVSLINTATRHVAAPVTVGNFPAAATVTD